jgi:hypothetical protein
VTDFAPTTVTVLYGVAAFLVLPFAVYVTWRILDPRQWPL